MTLAKFIDGVFILLTTSETVKIGGILVRNENQIPDGKGEGHSPFSLRAKKFLSLYSRENNFGLLV